MARLPQVAVPRPISSNRRSMGGDGSCSRSGVIGCRRRRGLIATGSAALLALLLAGFTPKGCSSFIVSPAHVGSGSLAPALGQEAEVFRSIAGERRAGRWGSHGAARRRRSGLEAQVPRGGAASGDRLRLKNAGAFEPDEEEEMEDISDEAMRRLMFDMDPDSDRKGPMYFGNAGMYGEEIDHVKYPEEVRFPQCYLAFCLDRDETEEEEKNYVTWGVRKKAHWEHLKWARIAKRTFDEDSDREAGILWDRSVLSPSKYRVIGNMFCIRSYTKEGALRLLEEDPYRKNGLFGTVSVYRYPYNMGGGFNWQMSTYPYLALCMHKEGTGTPKLMEAATDAHLKYYEKSRRCLGEGPIYDSDLAEDDPNSKPIGSLMFFNAINDEEARETAEGDPFNEAGLYDSIFIARFNEIDLCGRGISKANIMDPMREVMAKEGLDYECEYPTHMGKFNLLENMKWLETEVDKKQQEQYAEYRRKLYQQRDRRVERGKVNEGVLFRPGVYVYMGKRTEDEWYDYWPTQMVPNAKGYPDDWFTLERSYLPVDHVEDDLD